MPDTVLQLTFHPQHFDVAKETPRELRRVLIESADDAGGKDVHFSLFTVVNRPDEVSGLRKNLEVIEETLSYLNGAT